MTTTTLPALSDVKSVYSGVLRRADGRMACCCGCAGKYTYASAHRDAASAHRGYTVTDDEVNDRTIKTIYTKVARAIADGAQTTVDPDLVCVESGNRLYMIRT